MSLMYFEGATDYVAATPALITTFEASGSIVAGRMVAFNSATDQRVGHPAAATLAGAGACIPAGLAIATCANGDPVPVLVWGYAKNIATGAGLPIVNTNPIVLSGAGYVMTSGAAPYYRTIYHVGKAISGSSTGLIAFINCMF